MAATQVPTNLKVLNDDLFHVLHLEDLCNSLNDIAAEVGGSASGDDLSAGCPLRHFGEIPS